MPLLLKKISISFFALLLGLLLVVWLGIWLTSPFLTRHFAGQALQDLGLELDQQTHVRLNIFAGTLVLTELKLNRDKRSVLQIGRITLDIDMLNLLSKELRITQVNLQEISVKAAINQDHEQVITEFTIAGFDLTKQAQQQEEATQSNQTQDADSEKANADNTFSWPVIAPNISFENIKLLVSINSQQHSFTVKDLMLNDFLLRQNILSTNAKGAFVLDGADINLDTDFSSGNGHLASQTHLEVRHFDLNTIESYLPKNLITQIQGHLNISASVKIAGDKNQPEISISQLDGRFKQLDLHSVYGNILSQQYTLGLKNAFINFQNSKTPKISTQFSMDSTDTRLSDPLNQQTLIHWQKLTVDSSQLQFEENHFEVNIPAISLNQFSGSERTLDSIPALVAFNQLTINDIVATPSSASIDSINIDQFITNIALNEKKEIDNLVDLSYLEKNDTETKKHEHSSDKTLEKTSEEQQTEEVRVATKETENKPQLILNALTLSGENTILFSDASITPAHHQKIAIDTFEITHIDSKHITKPSTYKIAGSDGDYMKFDFSGEAQIFNPHIHASSKGFVREFSLPQISHYLSHYLDIDVKKGQLDTDLDLHINNDKLDGKTRLTIRGASFAGSNKESSSEVLGATAIPLNVALNMIKDRKGNIKLSLPLKGDIDDPKFGVSKVLGMVIKKATMNQAKSYLMKTFVPYSEVVSVAIAAGSFALKVRFEELKYNSNEMHVNERHNTYVQQFIQLMSEKPNLAVNICPMASMLDQPAQLEELAQDEKLKLTEAQKKLNLLSRAQQRATNFKDYVLQNSTIKSSRMLICKPNFHKDESDMPSLKISSQ